ncbi:S-methyl thiohydantoin desulfurase domain-containing protein [Desulforegula conservatrix]|uniref:S-methyl thiohydantoin desulfurase domain-containing protein n=1 Tax=Desulforegula conservatrix TaxID=153026 RepID=UPI000410A16A|nr:DUF917 family protein [Desulforegula conservatrix]
MDKNLIAQPFPVAKSDLKKIVYGACFFASGGGGPISMAIDFLDKINKTVYFINTDRLELDKYCIAIADMGSPDAGKEGKGYTAPVNVFKVMADYLSKQGDAVSCILPFELGAVNTLIPFYVASQMDSPIPVINADPAGRAVPELEMTLLDMAGTPICPGAVASDTAPDGTYQSQMFFDLDPDQLEDASRDVVIGYGGVGGLACYPIICSQLDSTKSENEKKLIQGSVGLAWNIGEQLLKFQPLSSLQKLLSSFNIRSYMWISGKITKIDNRSCGGFDVGKVILSAQEREIWIYYKNESLLAWDPQASKPLGMGPDGIAFVLAEDHVYESGTPVSNADISEGVSYNVMGFTSFEKLRNQTLVNMFMKNIQSIVAAFPEDHVNVDVYVPIEKLNAGI